MNIYRNNVLATPSYTIPRILHRTTNFYANCIPNTLSNFANGWRQTLVDDNEQYMFIKNHFSDYVTSFYKNLHFSTHKADLYRYCRLYIEGGVYFDIKTMPLVSLDFIIRNKTSIFVITEGTNWVHNGVIATFPKNPIMLELISKMVGHKNK